MTGLARVPASQALPFDETWFQAWAAAFTGEGRWVGRTTVHTARSADGQLRALLGLGRQKVGPLEVPSLGGYYWPQRGVGFVGHGDVRAAVCQLAQMMDAGRRPALIRMGPVAADDAGSQALLSALASRGWRRLQRTLGTVMRLELPKQLAGLNEVASTSMLKNLAYLRRRLGKQVGEVRSSRHSLCDPGADALIERLAAIEQRSWVSEDGGIPKFAGARNRQFWSAFVGRHELPWQPTVWILQVGDTDVAFSAHIEAGGTIWILANSYDAAWKPHSPGSLLTLDVLTHGIEHGVTLVDWGQGDSGYKSRWGATEDTTLHEHLLFPPHALGVALHGLASRFAKSWSA